MLSSCKLDLLRARQRIAEASGFFYEHAGRLFLVTNRPVVHDQATARVPDCVRLRLHTNPNDARDNAFHEAPLYGAAGNPLWFEFPSTDPTDLAVVPLNRAEVTGRFTIRAFDRSALLPDNYVLDPGEDVFLISYPLGFHDDVLNLPVFRNAMIASTYGVNFRGLRCFLTDANLHPGTSGSPVITKPKSTWRDREGNLHIIAGATYYLLGVHSGTYSVPASAGGQEPLGLGAAWYAQLIDYLIPSVQPESVQAPSADPERGPSNT